MVGVGGAMTGWRALPALHAFRHYHGGGVVLAVLCPAAGFLLVGSLASGVLYTAHFQRLVLQVAVAVLVVDVVLDVALVLPGSYVGAAVASTAGEAVAAAAMSWMAWRRLGVGWDGPRLRQALTAAAILAGVLGLGYALPPLAQLAVGVVTVPAALWWTGALRPADLVGLRRQIDAPATRTPPPRPPRAPAVPARPAAPVPR
jgi:O-antigen/teichoic acid export membrane protein